VFSRFFIDRPIFAAVVSIVITLAGCLALLVIPVAQYPEITPPQVQVSISYPGASAQVVADTVAAPVEQQVNGGEGMLYMSSQSGNDGSYSLSVTFEIGTKLNTALVMVQNRVALAMPQLPTEVQLQGISIRKKTPDILQVISFTSTDGRYDNIYLSNFATINVRDELLRVEGVSDINVFGQRDYSVRLWLDPQKMAARNVTANDVAVAIRAQNLAAAPGRVGQPPGNRGRGMELTADTLGRLTAPEQFADVILKTNRVGLPPAFAVGGQSRSNTRTLTPIPTTTTPQTPATTTPSAPASPTVSLMTAGGYVSPSSASATTPTVPTFTDTGTAPSVGTTGGATTGGPASPSQGTPTNSTSATTTPMTAGMPGQMTAGVTSPTTSSSGSTTATGGLVGQDALAGGGLMAGPWSAPGVVRIRDIADVELGASSYTNGATFDAKPAVGLAIHLLPGANALDVADRIRARMEELRVRFPDGVDYNIAYDTTPFIRESIRDVVTTLFEAVALVALVVLLFLQNWRAAIIPLVAVPVAILGTFAVMLTLGFTLNNISLFGLVLAIGIVVDDAIVVVENVERWLERGLQPREAAHKAMEEVTGPVIAIALVLCAVFVPCAFVGGITGQFFRQFAVTITASTVFSAINSLTLSPALAAILMRPRDRRDVVTRGLDAVLGWFFRLFNRGFEAGTAGYAWAVGRLLRVSLLVLLVYGGLVGLTVWVFRTAPTGFVPDQDQGRVIISVQLPDSASLERTQDVLVEVNRVLLGDPGDRANYPGIPGIAHTTTSAGMSLVMGANSPNFGTAFVILEPFAKRQRPELKADAIMAAIRRECAKHIRGADVKVFGAAPVPGLSVASGFKVMVQDRAGIGLGTLQNRTDALVAKLQDDPAAIGVLTQFRSKTPQLFLEVDRTKCQALGVPINDVNQAMQVNLGSLYVNSFNEFGRHWQVTAQARGEFRTRPEKVNLLTVRNNRGEMIPLGTVLRVRDTSGPVLVQRYNMYSAAAITGNAAPGTSSGQAAELMEQAAAANLPGAMVVDWTELAYLQNQAGNTALYAFLLAVVFVFLVLAAQYESWKLPLAVILVVPMCLLCSVVGVNIVGESVTVFVQIGFIVLVGLASKNAILIVEFAKQKQEDGADLREAAVEASRLRLRPILMTSLAFILGVVPLVVASGAGAEMRRSLGTAVFAGMIGVTAFGVFLTPVFFTLVQRVGWETRSRSRRDAHESEKGHHNGLSVGEHHPLALPAHKVGPTGPDGDRESN
jgi:multidrug efflux pump